MSGGWLRDYKKPTNILVARDQPKRI